MTRIFGIDFDGTIAMHEYPRIGPEVPGAIETLKALMDRGHKLILWTMRSGRELEEAVQWCDERGVVFWGVNENHDQRTWTKSPKAYCHAYIDDAALGCPLEAGVYNARPYVDWHRVRKHLIAMGAL